jgi:adenine phosphoribosyltransferase
MSAGAPDDLAALIAPLVRDVPDFPEPGIVFKDLGPLFADHDALTRVVEAIADAGRADGRGRVDKVVGIESRGFILGAPVALELGAGFVPVRKQGKLPGPTFQRSYALEYGEATLEVQRDAFAPGDFVLVVDDVLATGGTVEATAALVEQCGAEVVGIAVLIELGFLSGRDRAAGHAVTSLLIL